MEKFVVGDVVVVSFPFSDLSGHKRRPAIVLATVEFGNHILCQITSKPYTSKRAILLLKTNFALGSLPINSYARPDKLFTADPGIIQKRAGKLNSITRNKVLSHVQALFSIGKEKK